MMLDPKIIDEFPSMRLRKSMTRKQSEPLPFHSCCKIGHDFSQQSTLHGLRYVGNEDLHPCERIFWVCGFILSMIGAAYFISSIYLRWGNSPMIVSMSPVPVLLESIPFPAITLCNMNCAKKRLAEDILNSKKTDNHTLFEQSMIYDICHWKSNSTLPYKPHVNWTIEQQFFIKISQPCHDMLVACYWKNGKKSCDNVFNPELTDEGMCCTFNRVNRNFIYKNPKQVIGLMNYTFPFDSVDWTPETGYEPGTGMDVNPWRAWGSGRSMGLTLVLDAQVDEYYCSSTASVGFKAMIHNPVEVPKISDYGFFLSPGKETRVEIQPKITTSAANLANISKKKRLCLFSYERSLRFYRTYTQRNCQLECQSNFTLERCGCVPFYLPKDVDLATCGTENDICVEQAKSKCTRFVENSIQVHFNELHPHKKKEMQNLNVERVLNTTFTQFLDNLPKDENPAECGCLQSCDTVEYSRQMTLAPLEDSFQNNEMFIVGRTPAYYKRNMAVVHFFFVDSSFTGVEKGEIFGFTEFLSNTGGLLGLFLGFSIMSAVEIIYFMSLRIVCSSWRITPKPIKLFHRANPLPFTK